MSEESFIYGCIEGRGLIGPKMDQVYRLNKVAIESLPEKDEWPALTRDMFTVPLPINGNLQRTGFYRLQMIHFGCSFNNFAQDWPKWLNKFEQLLKRMYWHRAHLHLEVELHCKYTEYYWEANRDAMEKFNADPPQPVSAWMFKGGPRLLE